MSIDVVVDVVVRHLCYFRASSMPGNVLVVLCDSRIFQRGQNNLNEDVLKFRFQETFPLCFPSLGKCKKRCCQLVDDQKIRFLETSSLLFSSIRNRNQDIFRCG